VQWRRLPPLVLPLPTAVARALVQNLLDGFLWPHLWITLSEIVLGFVGGSALGIGLGSLVALAPWVQRILNPYIIASQAMPKLALAPLFVIWCGFGIVPKALIAALIAFFPLILIEAPSSAYHRGMLSLENNHSHEEETSCASTPNSTNFIVVSTCTLVPCTSVF